jgi:WD40 repeat protein
MPTIRQVSLTIFVVLFLTTACNLNTAPTFPQSNTLEDESDGIISPENVEHIAQIIRWGRGTINAIASAPDNTTLAVASSEGIYLYDTQTFTELGFINTGTWVTRVAFAPDGKTLASGSRYPNNAVLLWRVSDGTLLHTLEGHTYSITSLAFTPDGKILASGSSDDTVRLWNVKNGDLLTTIESGHSSCIDTVCGITNVAFAPDGQILASAMVSRGKVKLWQTNSGTLLYELEGSEDDGNVVFLPDGETMISWSDGGPVFDKIKQHQSVEL